MSTPPLSSTVSEIKPIVLRDVKANPKVKALIDGANTQLMALGYTEHGPRHLGIVAGITRYIMDGVGAPPRQVELGQIAAYLHDIGNVIHRTAHPATGAGIAFVLLNEMGMPAEEIAPILGAIGNHEENSGQPISVMAAALQIGDKSDVHRSRVQNPDHSTFDIHDRVNYAVVKSEVKMDKELKTIELMLTIDTQFASVMEYFEIFLSRMVMCRTAAGYLGCQFHLTANGLHLE
jgi:uncharacterized protein